MDNIEIDEKEIEIEKEIEREKRKEKIKQKIKELELKFPPKYLWPLHWSLLPPTKFT